MEPIHSWGHPPFGPPGGAPPFLFPLIGVGMFILFALLVLGAVLLLRRGGFGPPPWVANGRFRAPEFEAKRILSERFANGDISSDEFLERASVLNWTPGVEPVTESPRKRR